jgi:hypothetical protein
MTALKEQLLGSHDFMTPGMQISGTGRSSTSYLPEVEESKNNIREFIFK